jgi:hypothetical protein
VVVAIRTGVSPAVWLEDTRALFTACEVIADADARARRRGR